MKIKRFRFTVLEFVAVIFIIVGVLCVMLTVLNPPLSDVSKLELEVLELQPETESPDFRWMIRNRFSDISGNDSGLNSETLAPVDPASHFSDEAWNQFEVNHPESEPQEVEFLEQNQTKADSLHLELEEVLRERDQEIREALMEAKQLFPIVMDYEAQRKKIASKKAPSQQLIEELEALDEVYGLHVSRLGEIYSLVTDNDVVALASGDWVKAEADAIFGPLGW